MDTLILAVDGGGTRCRIAIRGGGVSHQTEVGAANVSTDFDAASCELRRGLKGLADKAGLEFAALKDVPAYLGLAGITGDALADRLAAELPFRRVRIADDRAASVRGALGARDGYVAHCGTGSFIASQISGQMRFAGGWGPVLGDQASAKWVGRQVLARTLDSVDGFAPSTDLTKDMLSRFEGAAGIVRAATGMTPTQFGTLAPIVTRLAAAGDTLAASIMRDAAGHLADRLRKMGWVPGLPVCLTGGIGPQYAGYFPDDMTADLTEPDGDPLAGALALARVFQKEIEDERG